jgi:lactoylglutathione lyase
MHIAHLAIWVRDLENLKPFYERYFGVQANTKYINAQKQFQSYFLTFNG